MKNNANPRVGRDRLAWMPLAILLLIPGLTATADIKLDVLKTKTTVYKNVTVTSRTKTDIYILHAAGICNLKLADLPPETLQQLDNPGVRTITETSLPSVEETSPTEETTATPTTTSAQEQLNAKLSAQLLKLRAVGATFILVFLAVSLVFYLFFCYCFSLICKKTGNDSGVLIWLPVLQMIPLLRAAGMSPLWILAGFVPVLNLVAQILWCINITKAREKPVWVAILLILPFTNLFALLYLAFSNGGSSADEPSGLNRLCRKRIEHNRFRSRRAAEFIVA